MWDSFYGWYFKCQSDTQTLAVIPAVHRAGRKQTCSIQFITDTGAWMVNFSGNLFHRTRRNIFIGRNSFGGSGLRLDVNTPELRIKGQLDFGELSPLKYDIMGPFVCVPFLECRHSVWSMRHTVCGEICINGHKYCFKNAWGYWEGDRGRSFPKKYVWTQCCFQGGSLMLSVADIPMAGFHFTGIVGIVLWQEHEYRLATYLGARAVQLQNGKVRIVQGDLTLEACLLEDSGNPLMAPAKGNMIRTIHESVSSKAFYRFRKNREILFEFKTRKASFEYEYPSRKEKFYGNKASYKV